MLCKSARPSVGEPSFFYLMMAESHSGRRTFVTRCAKKIVEAGGSLRDVQELAGHASLATTQRYIQGDTAAKRRVVDL